MKNMTDRYVLWLGQERLISAAFFRPEREVVVYDPLNGSVKEMKASDTFADTIGDTGYTYYLIALVATSGIVFLGEPPRVRRIADMTATQNGLEVKVDFAPQEQPAKLHGYYEKPVTTDKGKLTLHPDQNMFDLVLAAPKNGTTASTIYLTVK